MIQDFSTAFHDGSSLRSNLTRARHLMDESGLDVEDFADLLYEARAITKRQGNIEKPATEETDRGWTGMRNKMPYFWAVVEGLIFDKPDEAARES